MFIDKAVEFSNDQDLSQVAGTYSSASLALKTTGSIDEEYGGEAMEIIVQVTESFVGATATVDIRFVSAESAALGTPTTQGSSGAVAVANLTAGTKYRFPLVLNTAHSGATHIGVNFVIATATTTAGTVTAWIQRVGEDQNAPAVADGL